MVRRLQRMDVWWENLLAAESDSFDADNRSWLRIVGRLKPGVSLKEAEAELRNDLNAERGIESE